ncbi:peroxiredoxin-like 2C isoform X2 [Latimeria chalumnae]|uniref:Peroxiredoxin like 2C n=1 Tax=Latimeria chalumnae TaxID=7897 RepID=H3ALA4_LATCH|nr:PREDICTED: thioredoxin-like protein AAED1 [Latimeria chalumnae]|eukprot:XP_006001942.1 PREDICTED: thioredoxin-like protein AAED1 [Latimeria chalumnae]
MATHPPVTQQIGSSGQEEEPPPPSGAGWLREAEKCYVLERRGSRVAFKDLYQDSRAVIVFVRHFLCYTCKEYVEDLAKIPKRFLTEFCSLIGYSHEIYVDPDRIIYKKLGMKRGETFRKSARSPHVKSNMLTGSIKSIWRAMTSPAFDFQGDPAQQGGALIVGPGDEVHFCHLDMNRLDHMPIHLLLQLAGVQTVDFTNKPQIIDV